MSSGTRSKYPAAVEHLGIVVAVEVEVLQLGANVHGEPEVLRAREVAPQHVPRIPG